MTVNEPVQDAEKLATWRSQFMYDPKDPKHLASQRHCAADTATSPALEVGAPIDATEEFPFPEEGKPEVYPFPDEGSTTAMSKSIHAAMLHDQLEWEKNIYSLMILSGWKSLSFIFALFTFALQTVVLLLILWNMLDNNESYNPFNVPINNTPVVVTAQFCALIILVILRCDCFVVFANLPMVLDGSKLSADGYSAPRWKWILGNGCRVVVKIMCFVVAFVFIMQANDVLELFKDFVAVEFVSDLDVVAFIFAINGFIGNGVKKNATYINISTIPVKSGSKTKRKWMAMVLFFLFLAFVAIWSYYVNRQRTNMILMGESCMSLDIRIGTAEYDLSELNASPFPANIETNDTIILMNLDAPSALHYPYFNGVYMSNWKSIVNKRPTYFDSQGPENFNTTGRFSYCMEESVWVFTIESFNDSIERGDCGQWLLRSEKTDAFILEDVSSEWTVWTGSVNKISVETTCIHCGKLEGESGCNFNGKCDRKKNTCTCKPYHNSSETWFGESCQAEPPCAIVDTFVLGETSADYTQTGHFMPLLEPFTDKRVLAYQRPVYWNKRNLNAERQSFLLYTGNRWYITEWPLKDICPSYPDTTNCGMPEFARFFTSDFHAYWFDVRLGSTEYISEETDSFTPIGLKWFTLGKNGASGDFGGFGYTYDEGFSAHCFKSDCEQTNLCGKSGNCVVDTKYGLSIRSICQCTNGSSGYFCQFDQEHPYARDNEACNEYFCDYFLSQETFSSCSDYCNRMKQIKTCWNSPTACTSNPADDLKRMQLSNERIILSNNETSP